MKKRKNKRWLPWVIAIAVILVIGIVFSSMNARSAQRMIDESNVFTIEQSSITQYAVAAGKISSSKTTRVDINGTFRKSLVNVGDHVEEGEKIGEYLTNIGQLWAVVAKADGIITQIPNAASNFFVISDPNHFQVQIAITEKDVVKISVGQSASVYIEALNATLEGEVADIGLIGNTQSDFTTYTVTVVFDHGELPVFLGMSASSRIEVLNKQNIAVVPIEAIITSSSKRYLLSSEWLQNQNDRQSDYYIEVTTGISDVFYIEVTGDNLIGQEIVILPQTSRFPFFGN